MLFRSVILPYCIDDSSPWCIESLNIQKPGINANETQFLRQVKGIKTPAYPDLGFPAGSTISLWRSKNIFDGGGTETYAVYVMVRFVKLPGKVPSIVNMSATVLPYVEVTEDKNSTNQKYYESQYVRDAQSDGSEKLQIIGGSKECAWTEDRVCGLVEEFPKEVEVSLSMRVGNKLTGWFMGRLQNPVITTASLNKDQNLLKIKANPVEVPKFYATTDRRTASPEITASLPRNSDYYGVRNGLVNDQGAFATIATWKSVAKDTAAGVVSTWSATTILNGMGSQCLADKTKVLGVVTTNAMVYEGTAPRFENSTLNYQVGGMHYNPDGSVFQGSYDLVMRKATAQCLYGFTNAPITATVTVVDAGKEERIETSSLQEFGSGNDKWLKLTARGFTFSSPTLKIKLNQARPVTPAPAPSPTPSPSASAAATTQSTTQSAPAPKVVTQKSITCVKGKVSRKVVGANPTCPAGFKKK